MISLMLLSWLTLIRLLLHYPQSVISQKLNTSLITSSSSLHTDDDQDTCCGRCAVEMINDLIERIGKSETSNLISLNYNSFLFAMSNATILHHFCKEFQQFEHCCSTCSRSFSQEILMGYSQIIDHICVYNFKDIKENFGCLARLDLQMRQLCMRTCTAHQEAFHSMVRNFRHFILNNNVTVLENYLDESCEYVLCSLHCDVPLIAHNCGYELSEKVIALTRKSFKSLEKMSLDVALINRWPQACIEITTYRIPKRNLTLSQQSNFSSINQQLQDLKQTEANGYENQKFIKLLSLLLSLFIHIILQ